MLDLCQIHRLVTDQQCADIIYDYSQERRERSDDNKNVNLVKAIQRAKRLKTFERFLAALRDNDQRHVAAYIVGDGCKALFLSINQGLASVSLSFDSI